MTEYAKQLARERRGFISETDVIPYSSVTVTELNQMLNGNDPKQRTIATVLIGRRQLVSFIPQLCQRLRTEKSLYPRIAASEALGNMGEAAVESLISMLGRAGDNQERNLPVTCCKKKSFPLARDLAARTLVKLGRSALPALTAQLQKGDSFENQQAIDAIGGIVSKTKDFSPLPALLQALTDYQANHLIVWKIIRALSAFRSPAVISPLLHFLKDHPRPAIRWEAANSLSRVGINQPEVIKALQDALQDDHPEVRTAVISALKQLESGSKFKEAKR